MRGLSRYYLSRALVSAVLASLVALAGAPWWGAVLAGIVLFAFFIWAVRSGRYVVRPDHGAAPLRTDEYTRAIRDRATRHAFAALMLKQKGCIDICLGDTNPLRRHTADKLGVCTVYDPLGDALPEENSFDLVIDAVGSGRTRAAACTFVSSGGVISHVGLQDNEPGLDTRRMTLEEITFLGNYTYSAVDLRAAIDALYRGALGPLDWVETRPLSDGAAAFRDIHEGNAAAPKIVLQP